MAIDTMDKLIAALGNSQDQQLFFPSASSTAAVGVNLNMAVTGSFGIMANPAANTAGGTTYNRSSFTAGFPRWNNATSGNNSYIGRLGVISTYSNNYFINDLFWACMGFSGTVTTPQAVTGFSGLPSRAGTGVGAEIWVSCSTATGATASNITITYTNSDGVGGRVTKSTPHPVSFKAYNMYKVPLQDGDVGVQSIQSMQLSASTGTAGSIWLMIGNRINFIECTTTNVGFVRDFTQLGLPQISDDACILFVALCTSTASGICMGQMSIIQG